MKRRVEDARPPKRRKPRQQDIDSDLESNDEEPQLHNKPRKGPSIDEADIGEEEGEDELFEAPEAKKLRLAKRYLHELGMGRDEDEAVAQRLHEEVAIATKKIHHEIGHELSFGSPRFYRGHKQTPTCVAVSPDERSAYTGGKDCAIIQWDLETGQKTVFPGLRRQPDKGGHTEQVLDLCVSEDANLVVSAGVDRIIRLWDIRRPGTRCVDELKGHTGAVTCVCADPDASTNRVYTASNDKSIKIWDLNTRSYVNTLYGHTSKVLCMDILARDRPLTGGEDRTVRYWKMTQETHLIFQPPQTLGPIDAVSALTAQLFASGAQDGSVSLWSISSRKPLATIPNAHGGQWITALASVRYSDAFFSGSCDGVLRAWHSKKGPTDTAKSKPTVTQVAEASVDGCITSMCVAPKGGFLLAAVGKEHRHGRWISMKGVKNGLVRIPLHFTGAGELR
ncbi:unnamed protein product [Vitrella brassicaformis CCMP3155]|uniref:Uncharacterized protein n=2 Tax=Vitrella brassicaformis TaxID=1169539 RepID=A0A0G4GS13_VITBC|nr:unnamed protein product [Vitrella brassicaformis CCMP3155]|eukprot:CEM33402.1 unnamed protein product [Vitrella brassicaformis CCMP3155]